MGLLATPREALAIAPGINAARVIALRSSGPDAYGKARLECIVAGRWTRAAFNGVRWQEADATTILQDTASELAANIRRSQPLPMDLAKEPEIPKVLAEIDTSELPAARMTSPDIFSFVAQIRSHCGRSAHSTSVGHA